MLVKDAMRVYKGVAGNFADLCGDRARTIDPAAGQAEGGRGEDRRGG